MRGIINNIITFYGIQAEALGILVTNTQKALKESERERKANEQAERIGNSVKGLATDLNNMITRIYFLKEHKDMTKEQTTTLMNFVNFVNFVKTSTENIQSLLDRFQKADSQTFEEKLEKEIKEIEAHIKQRLKEYDEALSGTSGTLKYRLCKYVSNKAASIKKFLRGKSFGLKETEKAKLDGHQAHGLEDAPIDSIDSCHTQLESFVDVSTINTGGSSSKKSEQQIRLEI